MPQSIHILRKDLRHLWPETLLVLTLTAAYALLLPFTWASASALPANFPLTAVQMLDLATVVMVLLPLSWLVLIARATHAENLIGTRQFWLTRPYRWHSLLIARLLFFALTILLPFFAAQASMLLHEHLPLAPFLAGLTCNLAVITVFFVLPFFTLATICSSLLRIIGTILSTLVIVGAIFFFFKPLQGSSGNSIQLPDLVPFWLTLAALTCALLILLQFATRRLLLARALALLVAIGIFVLVVTPFQPYLRSFFYPAAPANSPIRVTISSAGQPANQSDINLGLVTTLAVTGLEPGTHFTADDYTLTLQAPDGSQTHIDWNGLQSSLPADDPKIQTYSWIKHNFLHDHHGQPLTFSGEVAVTLYRPVKTLQTTYTPGQPILIPDVGVCSTDGKHTSAWFWCQVPSSSTHIDRLSAPIDTLPCGPVIERKLASQHASTWRGGSMQAVESLGFEPFRTTSLYLTKTNEAYDFVPHESPSPLCPGSIITVQRYAVSQRLSIKIPAQQVTLTPQADARYIQ